MIDKITVYVNEIKVALPEGTTLEELSKEYQKDFKYPIVLAKVNNRIKELSLIVEENMHIEFLDLTTNEGNRAHISGLILLLDYTIKDIFGNDKEIKVEHSIDKGIYIKSNFKLTKEKIIKIEEEMQEHIKEELPIMKVNVDRIEAIEYFKSMNNNVKEGILKYNTNTYLTLYRLGDLYDYFFTAMPTSTKVLKDFALTFISDVGFVLRFPTIYITNKIKEYEHHKAMFQVFNDYESWVELIKIRNSVDLNKVIETGKISDLIRINEMLQSNTLLEVAKKIIKRKDKLKIVLLAGPSSSGKTTTSRKLCMYLKSFGLNPVTLSMDDYFVDRFKTPIDENGKPDFESLKAIDLKLFDKQINQLLDKEEVNIPTFNFVTGLKEYNLKVKLKENDIIIVEGIHALDPKILTSIERENKYKIYVSALTELNIDNHNRISTTDNRLLRRIIRDNRTRDYNVSKTLDAWSRVREGEEKYIFPYQDEADYIFNTALIYEIGVLRTYVEPLLYSVETNSVYYEEAKRLLNFLKNFLPIPSEDIPKDSVLREFIGGSCFHE